MKTYVNILAVTLLSALAVNTYAITISGIEFADNAIADQASGSGTFLNWNPSFDSTGISAAQLQTDMTDSSSSSYVFSYDADAYIDMTFNTVDVFNGAGNDLAVFFVGTGGHTGNLTVLDNNLGSIGFSDLVYTGYSNLEIFDVDGNGVLDDYSPIYVSYFDLDVLGIDGTTALSNFRLEIGNASAAPSLMAAINTTPVPLPAPLMLLLSGLAALGLVGGKKHH
jgi:hypothetical protein